MNPEHALTTPETTTTPEAEKQPENTPAIYIACLAAYNNGRLHGEWIDATIGAEEIHQHIQTMLASSPEPGAEEWAIHDYDNFGPLRLGEHADIDYVASVAEHIQAHGAPFAAWLDFTGFEQDKWHYFTDAYLGEYENLNTYITQLIEDLGYDELLNQHLPKSMRAYLAIDKELMARDLEAGGDIFTIETGNSVHIFDSRI
ncbi:antirestriction protein ArdA [Psychromicrobium xiongbiense]|uniref:antirestriction protein ArdA n=1 Tax=Psychromicrobium xiongbiense TaxID=3051184 RepID=UPI00255680B7|nr:antirestriction protein ArdA [Psychromicrobium sp. YIM S02556]